MENIDLQYLTINTPLPDFIYAGLASYSANANVYQTQPSSLIAKLAGKFKISQDSIFLTAGIDEAIQMFLLAYGQNSFAFTPSYIEYSRAAVLGGQLTQLNSISGQGYEINQI
jgi:histidinol-phosphate/aromatic aminotransferase/cobyric acid decarboxylase-like protein